MTNHIKKMLRIVEENLEVSEVTQELIKKKKTLVIHAVLSHLLKPCFHCGSIPFDYNGKQIVIKNGPKLSMVALEDYKHITTVIRVLIGVEKYILSNQPEASLPKILNFVLIPQMKTK